MSRFFSPPISTVLWSLSFLSLLLSCGCAPESETDSSSPASNVNKSENKAEPKIVAKSLNISPGKKSVDNPAEKIAQGNSADNASKPTTKIVKKSFVSGNSDGFATKSFQGGSRKKTNLTQAVLEYAKEAHQSNPTALIWIFDQTKSASNLREQVILEIKSNLASFISETGPEMAIVGFTSAGTNLLTPETTGEIDRLQAALAEVETIDDEQEKTFTAIHQVIDKFGSQSKSSRKTVLFVLVTDEAGDDANQLMDGVNIVDATIDRLNGLRIPLFAIGYAAPFGRSTDLVEGKKPETEYGPETPFAERISLAMWNGSTNVFRFDSGFGPWALEKTCRATGGRFLADRPVAKSMRLLSKMQSDWPAVTSHQFGSSVMAAYKPFYGSLDQYLKDVKSNPAKTALHEAAKMPHTGVFRMQDYEFRSISEAAMVRQINMTQRIPAVIQPGLEKLYNILKSGESGRESLSSKRWQASFDLAYGRTMANYIRVIGLNSMLAELKGGKSFSNANNNTWVLQPGEEVSTGSSNKKMAGKAKLYLQRVIDEHPDTPWAVIAKKELESPMGWKWAETKR